MTGLANRSTMPARRRVLWCRCVVCRTATKPGAVCEDAATEKAAHVAATVIRRFIIEWRGFEDDNEELSAAEATRWSFPAPSSASKPPAARESRARAVSPTCLGASACPPGGGLPTPRGHTAPRPRSGFASRRSEPAAWRRGGRGLFDEDRALRAQVIDDVLVVHDLVAYVDRGAESVESALHDLDRSIDTGTEAPRAREDDARADHVQDSSRRSAAPGKGNSIGRWTRPRLC